MTILWVTSDFSDWLWYIDIIRPYRRTRIGFDFEDLELDIVVARDLSSWRYKDEDELERLVQLNALTRSDARSIREVAHAAVRDIEARSGLFALGWELWKPPELWTIPTLPEDWDKR